ncbi:hypothetical protein SAMN05428978_103313 [Nitrosomonas sp. Nm34]|nr:hypothetical protein SAMN05428978_103313 [Nitrosomonas sp. Nm34]
MYDSQKDDPDAALHVDEPLSQDCTLTQSQHDTGLLIVCPTLKQQQEWVQKVKKPLLDGNYVPSTQHLRALELHLVI